MPSVRARTSENALMENILAFADTLQAVMLVGHNPGLTISPNLIGDGSISKIPPSSAC